MRGGEEANSGLMRGDAGDPQAIAAGGWRFRTVPDFVKVIGTGAR
jgi:hypothetical protein